MVPQGLLYGIIKRLQFTMNFNFSDFINSQVPLQNKYESAAWSHGGFPHPISDYTDGERYERVIEYLSHLIEEVVEARMLVKRRRWKGDREQGFLDDPQMGQKFKEELADIQVIFAAVCAYAGITGEEITAALISKIGYNSTREDHVINEQTDTSSAS
jgi:NTP pyrophosphatase (non-canonical NTP hydrolase)